MKHYNIVELTTWLCHQQGLFIDCRYELLNTNLLNFIVFFSEYWFTLIYLHVKQTSVND